MSCSVYFVTRVTGYYIGAYERAITGRSQAIRTAPSSSQDLESGVYKSSQFASLEVCSTKSTWPEIGAGIHANAIPPGFWCYPHCMGSALHKAPSSLTQYLDDASYPMNITAPPHLATTRALLLDHPLDWPPRYVFSPSDTNARVYKCNGSHGRCKASGIATTSIKSVENSTSNSHQRRCSISSTRAADHGQRYRFR